MRFIRMISGITAIGIRQVAKLVRPLRPIVDAFLNGGLMGHRIRAARSDSVDKLGDRLDRQLAYLNRKMTVGLGAVDHGVWGPSDAFLMDEGRRKVVARTYDQVRIMTKLLSAPPGCLGHAPSPRD